MMKINYNVLNISQCNIPILYMLQKKNYNHTQILLKKKPKKKDEKKISVSQLINKQQKTF